MNVIVRDRKAGGSVKDYMQKHGPRHKQLYFGLMFDDFVRRLEGGGIARDLLNGFYPNHPLEEIANMGRDWFMQHRERIVRVDMPDDFVEISADAFRAALIVMMAKIVSGMN